MATRYSGPVKITIRLNAHDNYKCTVTAPGIPARKIVVRPAAWRRDAIDSPKAYDETAHAALSFANDEDSSFGEVAWNDVEGRGWHISRSKDARANGRGVLRAYRPARKRRPAGHRAKTRSNGGAVPHLAQWRAKESLARGYYDYTINGVTIHGSRHNLHITAMNRGADPRHVSHYLAWMSNGYGAVELRRDGTVMPHGGTRFSSPGDAVAAFRAYAR